jgi:hypothetical protein
MTALTISILSSELMPGLEPVQECDERSGHHEEHHDDRYDYEVHSVPSQWVVS